MNNPVDVIARARQDGVVTIAAGDDIGPVAGIDHVGIGSDYDGVDGEVPPGMEDISKLPTLTYQLLRRGYSEDDVRKVLGENLLRVMARNEEVARSLQAAGELPSRARLQP